MHIKKLLQFGRKKQGGGIQVKKLKRQKQQTVGEMAAGNLSAASQDMARMMEYTNMATKVLVVQDGEHSSELVDYAVKMAQKLDCEIIALDVSEGPLNYSGERRQREINRFHQRAKKNSETIMLKAEAMAVACKHVAQIGNQEETIKKLSQDDKTIRYVLIKPVEEYVSVDRKRVRVPVVDLNCSSL